MRTTSTEHSRSPAAGAFDLPRAALLITLFLLPVLPFTAGCGGGGGGSDDGGAEVIIDVNPAGAALDPTFGGGAGRVFLSASNGVAKEVVEDGSGRLVIGGEITDISGNVLIAVWRLLPDGNTDTTFNGGAGVMTIDPSPTVTPDENSLCGLAIDNVGRIVVAGTAGDPADHDVFAARLLENGTPDATFGTGGGIVYGENDSGTTRHDDATGLAVDAASRITVTGTSSEGSTTVLTEAVAWRWLTIGLQDPNFDGDGLFRSGGTEDRGGTLLVDGLGQTILIGGRGADLALWLLQVDGTLEPGFGTGGLATVPSRNGGTLVPLDASIYDPVTIVISGVRRTDGVPDRLFTTRVFGDGVLDTGFGSAGFTVLGSVFGGTRGNALVVAPNGELVISGGTFLDDGAAGTIAAGGLWLLFGNGALDPSLGATGHVHLSAAADEVSDAHGVIVDATSKVVVVGAADTGAGTVAPVVWRVP